MKMEGQIKLEEKQLTIEEKEKNIKDKIFAIQLQYIDNLFLGKINPINRNIKIENFSELISQYSQIPREIMNQDLNLSYEEAKTLKERIINEIDHLYNTDHNNWISKSIELLNTELNKIEKKEVKNSIENKAGLIKFDMQKDLGKVLPGSGISNYDNCLMIHFTELYKQKNNEVVNIFSANSLEKLAIEIINNHPEAKAVVAHSWLMDTPIAKRIGFDIYLKDKNINNRSSLWGQFIDENGEIKKADVEEFLSTGIPKYRPAFGAIKAEDFLRKYLPREYRGNVILKDYSPESMKFRNEIDEIRNEIEEKWSAISFEEIKSLLTSNYILKKFFETSDGDEYLKLIKKIKETGIKMDDIIYENKERIREKFDEYINKYLNVFVDKKVFIE